jgi:Flp pilus assembly protein TadB
MGITLSIINPAYMRVLFEDPKGPMIIAIAAGMQIVGSALLWKIIHFEV